MLQHYVDANVEGQAWVARFCAEHGVTSEVEVVRADQLNEAYDRMVAGEVKYRFVLDTSTLGTPSERADA